MLASPAAAQLPEPIPDPAHGAGRTPRFPRQWHADDGAGDDRCIGTLSLHRRHRRGAYRDFARARRHARSCARTRRAGDGDGGRLQCRHGRDPDDQRRHDHRRPDRGARLRISSPRRAWHARNRYASGSCRHDRFRQQGDDGHPVDQGQEDPTRGAGRDHRPCEEPVRPAGRDRRLLSRQANPRDRRYRIGRQHGQPRAEKAGLAQEDRSSRSRC